MSLSLNNSTGSLAPPSHPACPGKSTGRVPAWAARLGVAAFAFFLIKGLAWLAVGTAVTWAAVAPSSRETAKDVEPVPAEHTVDEPGATP